MKHNSNKRKCLILAYFLLLTLQSGAQRLQITRFVEDLNDLTAAQEKTGKKVNGGDEMCGLVRVQFVGGNMTFDSKNIHDVEPSTSEYKVWMNPGASKLTIRVPGYLPLDVNFKKELGGKIKSKITYVMVIEGPQDKNAGRAYLTFESKNGEGCSIRLEGTGGFDETYTTDKNGKVENLHLPYGTYNYTASKTGFHTNIGSITLTGKPHIESIDLNSITGRLNVKTQETATLYIDGQKQDNHYATLPTGRHIIETKIGPYSRREEIDLPSNGLELDMNMLGTLIITSPKEADLKILAEEGAQQLNRNNYTTPQTISNVLGKYRVSVRKRGYEDATKVFEVFPKQQLRESFNMTRRVESYGFVDYVGTPKSPIGIMFGRVKRWGWYVDFKMSPRTYSLSFEDKKKSGTYSLYNLYKNGLKYPTGNVDFDLLESKGYNQWDITAGVMGRIFEGGYVFAGGGYGVGEKLYLYGTEGNTNAILFTNEKDNGRGPVAQLGFMMRIGQKFNLLVGYNLHFPKSGVKGTPMWGLGYCFYW